MPLVRSATARVVEPEILDRLPGDNAEAIRSRSDLRRLNWWMRNEQHLAAAIHQLRQPPRTIVETGSGDGTFILSLARRLGWKHPVTLIMLDMQPVISDATIRSLHELGWKAEVREEKLERWLGAEDGQEREEVDLVMGNLFWHHFSNTELCDYFAALSRISRAFIACEPRRWRPAQLTTRLLWVIGCNRVTRHDARVSVNAGFAGMELTALWPKNAGMRLKEYPSGWASHMFIAEKEALRATASSAV